VRPLFAGAAMTAALILSSLGATADAQTFPEKTIEIVNAFAPGGTNDLNIRAMEGVAAKVFGQPVVQVFKSGGGGISGTTEVANAKPDGYKLLVVSPGELTAGPNLTKTSYNLDSFAFIAQLSSMPYGFVVRSESPWKDFNAFKKAAAAEPGKYSFGTTPRGGVFLAVQHLIRVSDLKVTVVPYSGSGPYVTALLGGHVDAVLAPMASIESHLQAGTLRLLASTSMKRPEAYPSVPTFTELGVNSTLELWVGIVAPKGVPDSHLTILRNKFGQIAKDPEYIKAAEKLGLARAYAPADAFEKRVRAEDAEFKTLVKELGLAK